MTTPDSSMHPLTLPQREVWFDNAAHPGRCAYNIGGYLEIERDIDIDLMQQATWHWVQAHDALRTTLHQDGSDASVPLQSWPRDLEAPLQHVDFSSAADPREAALRWMHERMESPLPLVAGVLFRCTLIRLAPARHLWFLLCHHLIADGWTTALLTRSLGEIYTALERGASLPAATPPYLRFIEDDARYASSATWKADEEFWRARIAQAPQPLFLPNTSAPCRSECLSVDWPRHWYDAVDAFARSHGATVFHVVLAALYAYFVRTTSRDEIVLGLPVLNRSNAAFKATAGMFVGMTPARFDFGTGLSFIGLLQAIRRELRQGYRHQRFPISAIRRAIKADPDTRLFDLSVSYERQDYETRYATTRCKAHALLNGSEPTPLTLFIREFQPGEPVRCDHVFNTRWLDRIDVEAMQARLRGIIDQAMRTPSASIRSFALPTPAEREALQRSSSGPALDGIDLPYQSLFSAQVATRGDRIAAVHGNDSITYAELDRRSSKAAATLAKRGYGRNDLIALLAPRGIALLSMMLGVLKAGAAFVNLDPGLPRQRLKELLALSSSRCMLVSQSCAAMVEDILPAPSVTCLVDERLPPADASEPPADTSPHDLAYAIFTSGSTGVPKCVLVERLGLMNNMLGTAQVMSTTAADRIAQTAPVSFDIHVWQFLVALIAGAEVRVLPEAVVQEPLALLEAVDREGITVLQVVPSLMRAMLDDCPPEVRLSSLRWLVATGEALPPRLAVAWLERFPQVPLLNLYGPAECADNATWFVARTADEARAFEHLAAMPIGRPLPNCRVQVLDDTQQLLPPATLGEICIAGPGVGRGYLGDEQRTAATFLARTDPPGGRLYRTGDLGRMRMDGIIEYAGRRDGQVKIRGQRVEVSEVEHRLRGSPGVSDAAVALHRDARDQAHLIGYIVAAESFCEPDLMHSLSLVLPAAMVPSRIVRLEHLPLTPNGKLDRKALPPPDWRSGEVEDPASTPSETQARLASIWADLLRCESPGSRDHFFKLGGDSLLAMQITSRIRRGWHVEFSLEDVFRNPELAAMAKRIDSLFAHKAPEEEPRFEPSPSRAPLSSAQARMWFLDKLNESSAAYNMPLVLHLRGILDMPAMQEALSLLVRRHSSLRTAIASDGGELAQHVRASLPLPLTLVDLSSEPEVSRPRKARSRERAEALTPFNLSQPPLARATLLRLAGDSHRLLLTVHHAVADGRSLQILLRDLGHFYCAAARGDGPRSAAPTREYADHAVQERRWLASDQARQARGHWQRALQGTAPTLNLPFTRPRRGDARGQGAKLPVRIDEATTSSLRRLGEEAQATLFMTLAGVFGALLLRVTGQNDFCIGVPVSLRDDPEFQDVVGLFVNTVPLRLQLDEQMSFSEVVNAARESALQALSQARLPFDQIIEASGIQRNGYQPPLVQAMFSLDDVQAPVASFAGLTVEAVPSDHPVAKLDLTLELALVGSSVEGCFEYDTDLLDAGTVDWMADCFRVLLDGIRIDPSKTLGSVRMPERAVAARGYIDLFRARAQEVPMLCAVQSGEQMLTYDTLNTRSDRLARRLRRAGVRPDDVVGLCASRSAEMIVAMLAVLKAGGAYMPLDLALPASRIQFQLHDAAPTIILGRDSELARLPRSRVPAISLDAPSDQDDHDESARLPSAHPDSLAYVIYTSGTTGRPKGVGVTHRALGSYMQAMQAAIALRTGQRVLQLTSLSFDVSVDEILLSLHAGACVVNLSADEVAPGQPLLDSLRRHGINVLFITPSVLAAMSPEPLSLDLIVVGGERCPRSLVDQWLPHCRMINAYGPTETTVAASIYACRRETRDPPIGTALGNTTLYVLDDRLDAVPLGATGELFIGGQGVARGYLGQQDMTAANFLPDPFSSEPGARMYRTGDRVRSGSDGQLEYLGRLDGQVKLRGLRIELGEIEGALCSLPGIAQAAVLLRDDVPGGPGLVAFIASSLPFDEGAARDALAAGLPSYMVPSRFVSMPRLALNSSGKIDRHALAAQPLDIENGTVRKTDAPMTSAERRLAAIWQSLLGVERIERSDHFFGLGGHSLLATRLIARIKSEFGVELPLRAVFEVPVLSDMADRIDSALSTGSSA